MQIKREEYEERIKTATPLGLVIITYEMLLHYIEEAINNLSTDEFQDNVLGAIESNGVLMDSLDLNYEIGKDLMSIYVYINKLLLDARRTKDLSLLTEAKTLMSSLFESWQELAKSDDGTPVWGDSKIYEGLTYKNGKLNEIVVGSEGNDFKV